MILLHPPVSKPSEPPAGIAKLAGCLQLNNIDHEVIDMNLEGLLHLLTNPASENYGSDRWTLRAGKHREKNLAALRDGKIYDNESRYQRVVADINRLVSQAGKAYGVDLSLADYHDAQLTAVKSGDLLRAAENPQGNPFYPYFSSRLENVLQEEPEFLGFSLNYLSQALCTFAMIGFVRRRNPRQKIILGGSLTTSWLKIAGNKDIFRGLVDELVAGAGERRLLELLHCPDGQLDEPPAYDDFPIGDYLAPAAILPYGTAQGCYWHQCSFCPEKAEDNPYLPQPANALLAQLQELSSRMHPGLIHLLDNALSPALLHVLSQSDLGVPWYGFTRFTSHLANEEFCRALRRSGCVMLKLGVESGDQSVLDSLHKGIDLKIVSRALKAIRQAGIATYIYLLFGTPPENEESARKTLAFTVEHAEFIDFLNLAIFNLPALSPEVQTLATTGFYEGDLSLYQDFVHPLGWQRNEVRKFLEKTFKRHPAINEIRQHNPKYFTSNHAPFFHKASVPCAAHEINFR
ncbi:MAG: radical SAM protein [Deltaproteobacteria bacterium HGW-Deltaproteobacteria-12]|nr:MAG: radical SAM protein [Deltaproteobacteria bacterium HGW-Deltaproteobacteria-12]